MSNAQPAIMLIVRGLKSNLPHDEFERRYKERMPHFREVQGVISEKSTALQLQLVPVHLYKLMPMRMGLIRTLRIRGASSHRVTLGEPTISPLAERGMR